MHSRKHKYLIHLGIIMRKASLENLTPTRYTEGKKDRRKKRLKLSNELVYLADEHRLREAKIKFYLQ